jgi:hypothetical protein
MAERVAILETRVGSLKEDTVSIRTNIHGINNEMQKFVAAEMRCVDHLGKILEAIKDLPVILGAVAAFNDMRPELRQVFDERAQRAGLAAFGRRFGMIVGAGVALMTLLGGIAGGLVWLAQHLKPL